MTEYEKAIILENAKKWFRETILENHKANTEKLVNPKEFNINPFLTIYLANFLTGNSSPLSIAKALVYPRALGTSITGSFGMNMQSFTSSVLLGFGSAVPGIDIEFIDQTDGHKKYCQLKLGPNTINKYDVETIAGHFKSAHSLAAFNKLRLSTDDLIVGVMYGTPNQLSSHYKRITSQYYYPVHVGNDFWHRLTGDENFFSELLDSIASVAVEANFNEELDRIIVQLAETEEIKNLK